MKPIYRVTRNGQDISSSLAPRLLSISVTDEAEDRSDTLSFSLHDRPEYGRYMDLPATGDLITVSLGYEGRELTLMGQYTVDAVNINGTGIKVDCKSADMVGPFRSQRSQSWHMKKLSDILREIAARNGYEPALDSDLSEVVVSHVDQVAESDMSFLTRLSGQYDAVARPTDGKLVLAKRGAAMSVSGKSMDSVALCPSDCESWSYSYAAREDRGKARGLPRSTNEAEGGGIRAHYHNVRSAKRKSVEVGSAPFRELRFSFRNVIEATAAAASANNQQTRGSGSFSCVISGNPRVVAESPLLLKNWRPQVPEKWRIKTVQHDLNNSGFKTSIKAEFFEERQEDVSGRVQEAAASSLGSWMGDR